MSQRVLSYLPPSRSPSRGHAGLGYTAAFTSPWGVFGAQTGTAAAAQTVADNPWRSFAIATLSAMASAIILHALNGRSE